MKPSLYISRIVQLCSHHYPFQCENCPLLPPYDNDYEIEKPYQCVDFLLTDNPMFLRNKLYLSYLTSIINKYNLDCKVSYYDIYNAINIKFSDLEREKILQELRRVGREP
jgi:hypothetical protein